MISVKDNQLIFLLSMPRSGSTLLSLMLGSHPEICCPPEPWIVLALAEYFGLSNIRSTPYGREWAEIAAIEFLLSAERKQRGALSKALRVIGNTSHLDAITAARQTLQAAYQLQLDVTGKSVFIDKTPRYYAVLELIEEVFPKAKKIILLRNPLDVFASYKSTWEVNQSIFTPEGVSVHTRDFCEGLFKFADYVSAARDDVLVIRYEDLANDAERSLRSACHFADIDFSPSMLDYYKNTSLIEEYRQSPVGDPISSNNPAPTNNRTVNAWEKRLDRADIEALVNVLGIDVFERLGYGDTVIRLQDMSINIPAEHQAFERRKLLMQTFVENVHEQPFSIWNNFVSPLNECLSDRAARLDVIHQLQAEAATIRQQLEASETDRAARLDVIHAQQAANDELQVRFNEVDMDRAARLDVIHQLQAEVTALRQQLEASETDRAARLDVIHAQQAANDELQVRLNEVEMDRAARLDVIHQLQAEVTALRQQLEASETDRAARLDVIHAQQAANDELQVRFNEVDMDRAARLDVIHQLQAEVTALCQQLEASETDRAARLDVIHVQQAANDELQVRFNEVDMDRAARLDVIHQLQAEVTALRQQLEASETDRAARLDVIHAQQAANDELQVRLNEVEMDRAARLDVINQQQRRIAELKTIKGFFQNMLHNV